MKSLLNTKSLFSTGALAAASAAMLLLQACGSTSYTTAQQAQQASSSNVNVVPGATATPSPTPTPTTVLGSAAKYTFYLTGNNLRNQTILGCFTNTTTGLSNCFQNLPTASDGVINKSGSVTSVSVSTDSTLKIRAKAASSAGLTVAGYNATFVNNQCLQYKISVNGYEVTTRLLSITGSNTCSTFLPVS